MSAFRLCVVLVLLSACGDPHRPPEEAGSQETRLYTRDAIDTRREFRDAIIGQELRGEGVDVTVGADGTLVGTYYGRPFVGGWDYVRIPRHPTAYSSDIRPVAPRASDRSAVAV